MGLPQFSGYDTTIVDKLTELIAKTNDMILKQNESIATTNTQTNDLLNKLNENIQAVNNSGTIYSQASDIAQIIHEPTDLQYISFSAGRVAPSTESNIQSFKILTEGTVRVAVFLLDNNNLRSTDYAPLPINTGWFYIQPYVKINGVVFEVTDLYAGKRFDSHNYTTMDIEVKKGDIVEVFLKNYNTTTYSINSSFTRYIAELHLTTIDSPGVAYTL